jgi:hypothetical protein
MYDAVGEKEMLTRPEKMLSPSKLPKRIPVDLEIEPNLMRREEDQERPIDLLRKIKREKMLPPINMNLQKSH